MNEKDNSLVVSSDKMSKQHFFRGRKSRAILPTQFIFKAWLQRIEHLEKESHQLKTLLAYLSSEPSCGKNWGTLLGELNHFLIHDLSKLSGTIQQFKGQVLEYSFDGEIDFYGKEPLSRFMKQFYNQEEKIWQLKYKIIDLVIKCWPAQVE